VSAGGYAPLVLSYATAAEVDDLAALSSRIDSALHRLGLARIPFEHHAYALVARRADPPGGQDVRG
jgi:hypothetical protein